MTSCEHVDQKAEMVQTILRKTLDNHAPERSKKCTDRPKMQWYTDNLMKLKIKKRKDERYWRRKRTDSSKARFHQARNIYLNELQKAKSNHYNDRIEEAGNDQGKLFRIIKELGKGKTTMPLPEEQSSEKLSDRFCDFFTNKIIQIREQISTISTSGYIWSFNNPTCSMDTFRELTVVEVEKIIKSFSNATCNLDAIPTKLLKQCTPVITPWITDIVNESLQTSIFPSCWKQAVVKPLIKKAGLEPEFKNYRPVSNLNMISKVLEKCAIRQILDYVELNQLIPKYQSSYRRFHSTETSLIRYVNDLLLNMENQKVTMVVMLDLSAAFDTVDHAIISDILEKDFGMLAPVRNWILSYLSGREQFVKINGENSKTNKLECGLPQGSCLGPVGWLLYASKLFDIVKPHKVDASAYADDSKLALSFTCRSVIHQENAIREMENCIADVRAWMVSSKLKINDGKTELILFGSRQMLSKCNITSISVGKDIVKVVTSVRDLGVWLDCNLNFNVHVSKCAAKGYKQLYWINQIRPSLSIKSTNTIVHAFVTSSLDYCNATLYGMSKYNMNKMQRIQNCAARIVRRVNKYDHITPILKDLHWLKFEQRIIFKFALQVFKCLNNMAPTYLKELIQPKQVHRQGLRSSECCNKLHVPRTNRKTFADRAFSVAGPRIWNSLPSHITCENVLDSFKRKLKTFLFVQCYS